MKKQMILEAKRKLDLVIACQDDREKKWHMFRRKSMQALATHEDAWHAEKAQRKLTIAVKRVARAATFLRYLETK